VEKAKQNELFALDGAVQLLTDILWVSPSPHFKKRLPPRRSPMKHLLTSGGIPKIADFRYARVLPSIAAEYQGSSQVEPQSELHGAEQARGSLQTSSLTFYGWNYRIPASDGPTSFADRAAFQIPNCLKDSNFTPADSRVPSI